MKEIENEIALLKAKTNRKQEENTKMSDITKMEREMKHIETFKTIAIIMVYSQLQHKVVPQTTSINQSSDAGNIREKEVDLLICMDSNNRYIDFRKLWILKTQLRHNKVKLYPN